MAFDGICVAAVTRECRELLGNGRITKIAQPEKNEILITVKKEADTRRLFLNVSAGMPTMYLTQENKPSPMTAPNFCMVLRKHLQGGRILDISQPGLERVVNISVEHMDEMGDLCRRTLIFELMGKHSNLILTDAEGIIIDSLIHVNSFVSSVREVLPGRKYFIPKTEEKTDPLLADGEELKLRFNEALKKPMPVYKALYTAFTGISPAVAMQICNECGMDGDRAFEAGMAQDSGDRLFESFEGLMEDVRDGRFAPKIEYENDRPREFYLTDKNADLKKQGIGSPEGDEACGGMFGSTGPNRIVFYDSVSEMLYDFYSGKTKADLMRSKTADLRKHLQTILERDIKKLDLQEKQMKDAGDREKYRICGELLNAYAYQIETGVQTAEVFDYYENRNRTITLDPTKSATENAVRYFDKYNKCKRREEALTGQLEETRGEIAYLGEILTYIQLAETEEDLVQIRRELAERGFVKRTGFFIGGQGMQNGFQKGGNKGGNKGKYKGGNQNGKSGKIPKARPLCYVTDDGYEIYVGKNNYQNEAVTFEIATGNDWWFHAKGVPGAHVVVRCPFANQATEWEMPDSMFELAGALAAVNSRNKDMEKVEVDYLRKKNIKRPNNASPGFVVYYTNYSLVAKTDLSGYHYRLKEKAF